MIRRAISLYRRYLGHHLCLTRPGPPIAAPGLSAASRIALTPLHLRVNVVPRQACADAEFWLVDADGFRSRLMPEPPAPKDEPELTVMVPRRAGGWRLEEASTGATVPLPLPGRGAEILAATALVPRFARGALRALPLILRWQRTGDPALRTAIGRALGLAFEPKRRDLDPRLFASTQAPPDCPTAPGVTILVPVYNSFDLLDELIDRIEAHTDLPWHLIVIEDASSDRRVRPWLAARLARLGDRATLIENPRNLGFIGSVNRGFALALPRGWPVILLNSDAFVPPRWASRLVAPLLANAHVASVTPLSNDAELMTVPVICTPHELKPGQGDALDAVASGFVPGAGEVDMPTGVGFCMALSPDWLAKVPQFDPVFGRGYGEEVDWCQRVAALGGRHVGLPRLFVEHRGGASFGSAEKEALIARNNRIVESRYPRFPVEVQGFLADDPLATPRLALGMVLAGGQARGPLPLYVAHSMGGGAEIWLQERIAGDLAADGAGVALVLRLGGTRRWRLELHLPARPVQAGETDDAGLIARILAPLPQIRLVYSCAVGDRDPAALPDELLLLLRPDDTAEILFHDFFPLSPAYTLLDSQGRFRGVPAPDDPDPAHRVRRPDGQVAGLAEWRSAWHRLASRADRLTVFSHDSAGHVARAWPDLAGRIRCRPHRLHTPVPPIDPPAQGAPRAVAVLGNIGFQKGITLVASLGERLAKIPDAPRLVVIGNTDPAYRLPSGVKVHGGYALADLPQLVRLYGIGMWLIPSIWPETFSYTTREALATGLPVLGLGLGAQGAALEAHPNGHVVALDEPEAMVQKLIDLILSLPEGQNR